MIVFVKRDREIRTSTITHHEHEFEAIQRSLWGFFSSLLELMLASQVGFNHIGVGANLVWLALSDDLAKI